MAKKFYIRQGQADVTGKDPGPEDPAFPNRVERMGNAYSYLLLYRIFQFALLNHPIILNNLEMYELILSGGTDGLSQKEEDADGSCPNLRLSGENRSDGSVGSPWRAEGTQRSQLARRF